MAKVLMPWEWASAAATASLVESGFEAQSAMSAPPALRVIIRLAVSEVTCRQALTRMPCRGRSVSKRFRIMSSTGISRAAHSMRSSPALARPGFLMSLVRAPTLTCVLPDQVFGGLESDNGTNLLAIEQCPAVKVGQLDEELHTHDLASKLLHQVDHRFRGSARRNDVVHHQYSLSLRDGVFVNVKDVLAILEGVTGLVCLPGQLALFADRDKAGAETDRHSRAEHEAASLHGGDQVHVLALPWLGHLVDSRSQRVRVPKQRGDVAKEDARDRKIGHRADVAGEVHLSAALKYSRVRLRPSSRDVCGCHPRISRARVVSGRRCLGSSSGSGWNTISLGLFVSLLMSLARSSIVISS